MGDCHPADPQVCLLPAGCCCHCRILLCCCWTCWCWCWSFSWRSCSFCCPACVPLCQQNPGISCHTVLCSTNFVHKNIDINEMISYEKKKKKKKKIFQKKKKKKKKKKK